MNQSLVIVPHHTSTQKNDAVGYISPMFCILGLRMTKFGFYDLIPSHLNVYIVSWMWENILISIHEAKMTTIWIFILGRLQRQARKWLRRHCQLHPANLEIYRSLVIFTKPICCTTWSKITICTTQWQSWCTWSVNKTTHEIEISAICLQSKEKLQLTFFTSSSFQCVLVIRLKVKFFLFYGIFRIVRDGHQTTTVNCQ